MGFFFILCSLIHFGSFILLDFLCFFLLNFGSIIGINFLIVSLSLRFLWTLLLLTYAFFNLLSNCLGLIDIFIALHNVFDHFFHLYQPFPLLGLLHFWLSDNSFAVDIQLEYDSSIIQNEPLNKMFIIQSLSLGISHQNLNFGDFFSFLNLISVSLPLKRLLLFNIKFIIWWSSLLFFFYFSSNFSLYLSTIPFHHGFTFLCILPHPIHPFKHLLGLLLKLIHQVNESLSISPFNVFHTLVEQVK